MLGDQSFIPESIHLSKKNREQRPPYTVLFKNVITVSLQIVKTACARMHFLQGRSACHSPAAQNETRLFSLLPCVFLTLSAWQYLGWNHHKGILEKSFFNYKFNKNISMY